MDNKKTITYLLLILLLLFTAAALSLAHRDTREGIFGYIEGLRGEREIIIPENGQEKVPVEPSPGEIEKEIEPPPPVEELDPEPDPEPDPKPEPQPENQPETDSRKEVPVPEERPSAPIIYPGQRLVIPGTHDATPSPSRVISQGTVEGKSKQIALTFDSGWLYEETLPLLKVLDQQGVKATFFPRALWVYNKDKPASSYPDLAREIVKRGHTMGNHSLTHPDMRNLSEKEIRYEIKESTAIIKNITGVRPYLFRPPYGAYDPRVLKILGEEGYPYTIMWTIDTHDWASEMRGQKVTEDYIVKRVLDNATNNGIVLMHIGGKYTVGALPRIIKGLRAKGYTFTTVDKMLPPPKREQYIYTVKSGDTLYRIAQNYGVTVEEIIKANNL